MAGLEGVNSQLILFCMPMTHVSMLWLIRARNIGILKLYTFFCQRFVELCYHVLKIKQAVQFLVILEASLRLGLRKCQKTKTTSKIRLKIVPKSLLNNKEGCQILTQKSSNFLKLRYLRVISTVSCMVLEDQCKCGPQ